MDYLSFLRDRAAVQSKEFPNGHSPAENTDDWLIRLLQGSASYLGTTEIYCEVGCFPGDRLVSALQGCAGATAIAVEFCWDFDVSDRGWEELLQRLTAAGLEQQVLLCHQPPLEFCQELAASRSEEQIGLYVEVSSDDRETRLTLLQQMTPLLADQAILVLGCQNSATSQANWQFWTDHSACLFYRPSEGITDRPPDTAWQGVQIFVWDRSWPAALVKRPAFQPWPIAPNEIVQMQQRRALALQVATHYTLAEQIWRRLLHRDRRSPELWLNLANLYYATGEGELALAALERCLQWRPDWCTAHYTCGLVWEQAQQWPMAIQAYQAVLALAPDHVDAWNNLGNSWGQLGQWQQAEQCYSHALEHHPQHPGSWLNLGNVRMQRGDRRGAIAAYQQALKRRPQDADIFENLAIAWAEIDPLQANQYAGWAAYERKQYAQAIAYWQPLQADQHLVPELYPLLASSYTQVGDWETAVEIYRRALVDRPTSTALYYDLILILEQMGQPAAAIATAQQAAAQIPSALIFQMEQWRILPILYDRPAEISFYRQQFRQGLQAWVQRSDWQDPVSCQQALACLAQRTNFYLQYQCQDDLELQCLYGQWVHRVMASLYPQWVQPLVMPPLTAEGKIRIGYYSPHIRFHCGAKWALGWLQQHQRQQFEIYCYYTGRAVDQITSQFQIYSDRFHHLPDSLETVCEQIRQDQLHILIFTDIGIHPQTTQMAGLRLAPIQCTAWGHPVTSGSPTIDYYLSSDLMEPPTGAQHYSETLIRLPNLGFAYPRPLLPHPAKTRQDFDLPDEAVLYISCQSLFKYLPQHDHLFAEIAQQVPQSVFLFLSHTSPHLTEQFRRRLQWAFSAVGLSAAQYCRILPRQTWPDFLHLNRVADVYLDTPDWSGGNTTLEAILCGLPIVTLAGDLMRGRHAWSFLQRLGVTETIAQSKSEYVDLAVRLGQDRPWRRQVLAKMQRHLNDLYDDPVCVQALEQFYREAVAQYPQKIA